MRAAPKPVTSEGLTDGTLMGANPKNNQHLCQDHQGPETGDQQGVDVPGRAQRAREKAHRYNQRLNQAGISDLMTCKSSMLPMLTTLKTDALSIGLPT